MPDNRLPKLKIRERSGAAAKVAVGRKRPVLASKTDLDLSGLITSESSKSDSHADLMISENILSNDPVTKPVAKAVEEPVAKAVEEPVAKAVEEPVAKAVEE
ncbi:MAG: hypothetical protein EOP04_01645, partial [Proteobacteria bacterium]